MAANGRAKLLRLALAHRREAHGTAVGREAVGVDGQCVAHAGALLELVGEHIEATGTSCAGDDADGHEGTACGVAVNLHGLGLAAVVRCRAHVGPHFAVEDGRALHILAGAPVDDIDNEHGLGVVVGGRRGIGVGAIAILAVTLVGVDIVAGDGEALVGPCLEALVVAVEEFA